MTRRQQVWTWSAVAFVIFAAALGAIVERLTLRVVDRLERPTGWVNDRAGADRFAAALGERGVFASAAPRAMQAALGEDVFLWRAADKASRVRYGKPFTVSNQNPVGSCVAHGAHHAVWLAESVAWAAGLMPEAPLRPSTASIYGGSRVEARSKPGDGRHGAVGGWSDGSTGYHAAKWLRDWGVIYQKPYPEVGLDLTDSQGLEREWGAFGNGGKNDDGKLDEIARKHPIKQVTRVSTWDELAAAITAGFPVTIASNVGFSASSRDSQGWIRRNGVWPHQMACIGIRWARNAPPGTENPRDGVCVANSWGTRWPAEGGGKYPPDQPDGTFWATRKDIQAVLDAGDSWAFSTSDNWDPVKIDNGEWFQPGPEAPQADPAAVASSPEGGR